MYARINRFRGTKSKSLGCFFMALPALILVSISWGYVAYSTGFWYILAYLATFTTVSSFLSLMWWHDSDAWRDIPAMRKQWFWKGLVSFGLLGNPLGYKLQELSRSYDRWFSAGKEDQAILDGTESKTEVEHDEGTAWGKQSIFTACGHVVLAGIFLVVAFWQGM